MKVYIVRHGESETNAKNLWTGWANVHLTDKGKKQAQKVGEFLKNITFDKIYTSDLIRTIETAENTIAGCDYETLELLRETNVGELSGKPYLVVTAEQRMQIAKEGFKMFGGESKEELKSRVSEFMRKLESENNENVAVFTHGGWLRTFIDMVMGMKIPNNKMLCDNCTIAIVEYKNDNWKLDSWINLL